MKANANVIAMREFWQHENKLDRMRRSMELWDKKLSHLDDEMLYYVHMRASSIIEYRTKKGESDEQ